MKKTLIILGCMSIGFIHAQQQGREHAQHTGATKRVGINTDKPAASFEIGKVVGVPATQVQGFLLPHLSQTERNAMQKEALTNGLMIFNTSKNCIDWWNGTNWQCTDSSQKDEHGDEYAKYRATFSYTGTKTFTRNNCTIGQEAGTISYTNSTPIIGRGTSNISQAEADRLARENAIAEFERLGQEEANRSGVCRNVYTATFPYTATKMFTRNNCTGNQEAGTISYTNPTPIVGRATSYVSQAEADRLARENAEAEFNRLGQEEANRSGTCRNIYRATFSYTHTAEFIKNDCTTDQIGSKVSYTNPTPIVGTATSYVSQVDAERLAQENAIAEFNRLGQIEANTKGICKPDVFAMCRSFIGTGNISFAVEGIEENSVEKYGANNYVLLAKGENQPFDWDRFSQVWDGAPSGRYFIKKVVHNEVGTGNVIKSTQTPVGTWYLGTSHDLWGAYENMSNFYGMYTQLYSTATFKYNRWDDSPRMEYCSIVKE